MRILQLPQGEVEYGDVGDGPPVVLFHGVWMAASQWSPVVDRLKTAFRCITPVLPLGAHRIPMRPDADLSLRGLATLVVDVLDELEVEDATLVFNDWSCAQLLAAEGSLDRAARLVLASVETDDNYPPGVPGRLLALSARAPGGLAVPAQLLRFRWVRRLPITFGHMSVRPLPDDLLDGWLTPARENTRIRADLRRYLRSTAAGKRALVAATSRLENFRKSVLVMWGAQDRVMPRASGLRLAASFPDARFVEVPDSGTLIPLDQPDAFADELRRFIEATARAA